MRTIPLNLFQFSELSEQSKQIAIQDNFDINIDAGYNWYEFTEDDALSVNLEIKTFNIDTKQIELEFKTTPEDTAKLIIKDWGEGAEGYNSSVSFLNNELDIDQFTSALGSVYLDILQKDYDYKTSKEGIIETIEANNWEFTQDGKLFIE